MGQKPFCIKQIDNVSFLFHNNEWGKGHKFSVAKDNNGDAGFLSTILQAKL